MYMVMTGENVVTEETFYNSVNGIVDSHIKRLWADTFVLDNISFVSLLDYVNYEIEV